MSSKTSSFNPDAPYDQLPQLPPLENVETHATLKACIEARVALAELNMAGRLVPNQAILINTLPILEARASSEVENIVTTTDRLFQYAQDETQPTDAATKEALRYRAALKHGFDSLKKRPLVTATAIEICRTLHGFELDIRKLPGTALKNQDGVTVYSPPEGEALIRDLLANWEKYLHNEVKVDPLIRMAVGHYQFEAIHPFSDGNGRTGRILNLLFLVEQELLDVPILYLSRSILRSKANYYQRLLDVTSFGHWEQWILYLVDAVNETARWTTAKILSMRNLLEETTRHVRRRAPSLYSRELVELIFVQPYCRISNIVEAGLAKRQTASEYLKELAHIGVVKEIRVGREKLFIHPKLMTLLKSERHEFSRYRP